MPSILNSKSEAINPKQIRNRKILNHSNFVFLICLVFLIYNFVFYQPSFAQTLESDSYRIRMGNFNMTSGRKSSSTYALTDTVGQTAAGLFTSTGYFVKAGFQYLYTLYPFSFTISDLSIDLGTLTPGSFSTDSNLLTVSAPGQGYTVSTYEINRLTNGSDYIPDTNCNSGCTQDSAGVWDSPTAYGFGYNAQGDDTSAYFSSSSHFRPFPDLSLGDLPEPMMASTSAGRDHSATVTYQANIQGSQAAGDYETTIIYIATPTY